MKERRRTLLLYLCLMIVIGITCLFPMKERPDPDSQFVEVTGLVFDKKEGSTSVQLFLRPAKDAPVCGGILVSSKNISYTSCRIGQIIRVGGRLSLVESPTNPGQFDQKTYYYDRKIEYRMNASYVEVIGTYRRFHPKGVYYALVEKLRTGRETMGRCIEMTYPQRTADVLKAMILGDSSAMESGDKEAFRTMGILHILAISGMHVSILAGSLHGLLKKMTVPFYLNRALTILFLLVYNLFIGYHLSAVRASLMYILFLGADFFGRTYESFSGVVVSAYVLLILHPFCFRMSGTWLSYAAVLGPAYLNNVRIKEISVPPNETGWRRCYLNMKKEIVKKTRLPIFIWLFTSPVLLYCYYEISLLGFFFNLLLLPMVPFFFISGIIGTITALICHPLGILAGAPAGLFGELLFKLLSVAKQMPLASWVTGAPKIWQVVIYYVSLFVLLTAKGKRRLLTAGFFTVSLLCLFLLRFHAPAEVWFLDVGQGDCSVIRIDRGPVFMIDCGSSSAGAVGEYRAIPFLEHEGITSIDIVFASHGDEDHISGIREIIEQDRIKVRCLAINKEGEYPEDLIASAIQKRIRILELSEGDELKAKGIDMKVIGAEGKETADSLNDQSLVMIAAVYGKKILYTGDLSVNGEERLLEKGVDIRADYLKAGHHGSKSSSSEEFLQAVSPSAVIISCGRNNRYGHPSKEMLERVKNISGQIFVTKDQGAVKVTVSK